MLYIQTVIVYTLLALLMSYCALRSTSPSKQAKLWGSLPILLFTLVFGLRYGVGVDYNNYVEIYEETQNTYSSLRELIENERYELGFSIILYVCHFLEAPVYVLFSILAFIQIFLIYKTFNEENNILPYVYAVLIFSGLCMYSFMNIIRHEIAFCIFLFSIKYIRDNKLLKYLICCLLALTFHKSAILLFPLYFLWIRRKSIFNKPAIEVLFVLICFLGSFVTQWQNILHIFDNAIIMLGYEDYIERADEMVVNSKIGITRILNLAATIVIILNSRKIKSFFNSSLLNIIYDLFIIGTCMSYLFIGSMMLGRIIVYFSHTHFVIWAYALSYLYQTRKHSLVQLTSYITIIFSLFITYSSFIYNCKNNTGAYVSYFQTDLHAEKDNLRDIMMDKQNN